MMGAVTMSLDVFGVLRHGTVVERVFDKDGEKTYLVKSVGAPHRTVLDEEAFQFLMSFPLNATVSLGKMPKWARHKYREYLQAIENFNQHGLVSVVSDPKHWLGLTLKTVLGCNFGCTYCYEAERNEGDVRKMSKKIIRAVVRKVAEFGGGTIAIHGGEPGLYPEGIEYAAKLAKKYKSRYGARIHVSIQTNGLAVFTAWDIIREYDIPVGISYDGPYHDKYRVFKDGSPTSEFVLDAIKKLKEADHPFMVISVLDKDSDPSKLYQDVLERKIESVRMNPMYPVGHEILRDKMMPPSRYVRMMVDGLERLKAGSPVVEKRVREHADPVWGLKPLVCISIPCMAGFNFFDIDVDGNVAVCDAIPDIRVGNILKDHFWDFMFHHESIAFRARWSEYGKPCYDCQFKYYCDGGGCAGFLEQMKWGANRQGPYCLKPFFTKLLSMSLEDQLRVASKQVKRVFGEVIGYEGGS